MPKSRLKHPIILEEKVDKTQRLDTKWRWLIKYFQHLPGLLLSLPFYAALYWLINYVDPEKIVDLILPSAYLPFLILWFLANFFFLAFMTLNTRNGFLLSLMLTVLVFFKLNNLLNFVLSICIIAPVMIFIGLFWLSERKNDS